METYQERCYKIMEQEDNMTFYYNGEILRPLMDKSIADIVKEKGLSDEQCDRIIDWVVDLYCCEEFAKVFRNNREEDIDFGTRERLGISVLIPSEIHPTLGVMDYGWTTFRYCPYCGKKFRARLGEHEQTE